VQEGIKPFFVQMSCLFFTSWHKLKLTFGAQIWVTSH